MFRYVAFLWNAKDMAAGHTARSFSRSLLAGRDEWRRTLAAPGIEILVAGERPDSSMVCAIGREDGVVLGTLFRRSAEVARVTSLDAREAQRVIADKGRLLIESYWGRYVAFIRNSNEACVHIVRDPQGGMPCYILESDRVRVIFSKMEDCLAVGRFRFSINWHYVAAYLYFVGLRTDSTGLNEISELPAGYTMTITADGGVQTQLYWDPIRIANTDVIEDENDAIRAVSEATRVSVWAWASCYPRILHRLSGGLDSSIVLACLRSAPARPEVTCVNYFMPLSGHEDERPFARAAAKAAGCELIEEEESAAAVRLHEMPSAAIFPSPGSYYGSLRRCRTEREVATSRNATAYFSGFGGDQIFYRGASRYAVADYLFSRGMGPRLLPLSAGIAYADGKSFWHVLRSGIFIAFGRKSFERVHQESSVVSLVNKATAAELIRSRNVPHPWLINPARCAPGKLHHIQQVAFSLNPYNAFGLPHDPEPVMPLASQPLVEVCLRIPTYVLGAQGRNRAIARRAFEHEMPLEIVRRRTKGGCDAHFHQLLRLNLPFLKEMMLDGVLVRERLLHREKVERILSPNVPCLGIEVSELIYNHLSTEVWLRSWSDSVSKRVAA